MEAVEWLVQEILSEADEITRLLKHRTNKKPAAENALSKQLNSALDNINKHANAISEITNPFIALLDQHRDRIVLVEEIFARHSVKVNGLVDKVQHLTEQNTAILAKLDCLEKKSSRSSSESAEKSARSSGAAAAATLPSYARALQPNPSCTHSRPTTAVSASLSHTSPPKPPNKHVVVVKPRDTAETSTEIKTILKQHLKPKENKFDCTRATHNKHNSVFQFTTKEAADHFKQTISTNSDLTSQVEAHSPKCLNPTIVVCNVDIDTPHTEVEQALLDIPGVSEHKEHIRFLNDTKKGTLKDHKFSVPPAVYVLLEKAGFTLELDFTIHDIKSVVQVRQCFGCFGFDHIARNCTSPNMYCIKCSASYERNAEHTCPASTSNCPSQLPICPNCPNAYNLKFREHTSHKPNSMNCPIYAARYHRTKQRTMFAP